MKVFWIMLIWTYAFGFLWRLSPREVTLQNKAVEYRPRLWVVLVSFSIIIFFAGLRSNIIDTHVYILYFQNMPQDVMGENFISGIDEKGFWYFTHFMKYYIADDYQLWLFVIALISGVITMIPLYKHSDMYEISIFVFMGSAQFLWIFNGIRQYVAIAVVFACVDLIANKRFILMVIILILLSTFHSSALLIIPFVFLSRLKPFSVPIWVILGASVMIFFSMSTFLSITGELFENTSFSEYSEAIMDIDGSNILRLVVAAIPVVLVLIKRRKLLELDDKVMNVCVNMSIFNLCFMILSTSAGSVFFGRIAAYFDIFNILVYPFILKKLYSDRVKLVLYVAIIFAFCFWFYYQLSVTMELDYVSEILGITGSAETMIKMAARVATSANV